MPEPNRDVAETAQVTRYLNCNYHVTVRIKGLEMLCQFGLPI